MRVYCPIVSISEGTYDVQEKKCESLEKAMRIVKPGEAILIFSDDNLEEARSVAICWAPRRLTATDVLNIIQGYGYYNDTLKSEQYGKNTVEWKIEVRVKRVG